MYSLVYWSGSGDVYLLLPVWKCWSKAEEEIGTTLPRGSIDINKGVGVIRKLNTREEATGLFARENASHLPGREETDPGPLDRRCLAS